MSSSVLSDFQDIEFPLQTPPAHLLFSGHRLNAIAFHIVRMPLTVGFPVPWMGGTPVLLTLTAGVPILSLPPSLAKPIPLFLAIRVSACFLQPLETGIGSENHAALRTLPLGNSHD
jgi:hypothetical protein